MKWNGFNAMVMLICLVFGTSKVQADGFWAKLSVPFDGKDEQSCLVTYGNNGRDALPSPILQIVADKDGLVARSDGGEFYENIQFIAAGASDEAGVLYPGEEGQVSFRFRPGSGGSVSLRSSEGMEWYEKPWSCTADMLADISIAATRIALRGQDAKDYTVVRNLALAMKNREASSSIYGRMVDGHGAGVVGVPIKVSQEDNEDENWLETDENGCFATANLSAGIYRLSLVGGWSVDWPAQIEIDGNADLSLGTVVLSFESNFAVEVIGGTPEETTVRALRRTTGDEYTALWETGTRAVFRGLPDGSYRVECISQDTLREVSVFVYEGLSDDITIQFGETGTLKPRIAGTMATDGLGLLCYLDGELVEVVEWSGETEKSIPNLPTGDYLLLLAREGVEGVIVTNTVVFGNQTSSVTIDATELWKETLGSLTMSVSPKASPRLLDFLEDDSETLLKEGKRLLSTPNPPPMGEQDCEHNQASYRSRRNILNEYSMEHARLFAVLSHYRAMKARRWAERIKIGTKISIDALCAYAFGPVGGVVSGLINGGIEHWETGATDYDGFVADESLAIYDLIKNTPGVDIGKKWSSVGAVAKWLNRVVSSGIAAYELGSARANVNAAKEELEKAYKNFAFQTRVLQHKIDMGWFGPYDCNCREYESPKMDTIEDVAEEIEEEEPERRKQDVVLVIDSTGSMSDAISSVKVAARQIVHKILGETGATTGNRVAVVEYRDKDDVFVYRARSPFTTDATSAVSAINGISVAGGGDTPEALYATLRAVAGGLAGAWGAAERHIIVMTDAPPHDPDKVSGDTRASITALLNAKNIRTSSRGTVRSPRDADELDGVFHVHVVYLECSSSVMGAYQDLTESTGGTLQSCVNPNEAAEAILDALEVIEEGRTKTAEAEIGWKFLKATGTYFAQLRVAFPDGGWEDAAGLRYLFADRIGADGKTAAGLWSSQNRAALAATEVYGGETYRAVTLDSTALAAGGGAAVYGVQNLGADGVPVAERGIEMYVRKRVSPDGGNEGAAGVEDFVGYVAWEAGGESHAVPVAAGVAPEELTALRSVAVGARGLSVPIAASTLNRSLAVGVALDDGAEPYCTVASYQTEDGRMYGTVEVGATKAGRMRRGTLGANATVTLLGAETAAGPYEALGAAEVGQDGTFEMDIPEGAAFFRFRIDVADTVK